MAKKNNRILIITVMTLIAMGGCLLATFPTSAAESKPANPGFGTPVTDKNGTTKATGDLEKCQPGKDGCDSVYYKCYQGAKRKTYKVNSSECGVEEDDTYVDSEGKTVKKSVMYYMNQVINVVLGVIGVVSVVMIIMGGIQYTTSAGDATKAQKAQKTIIFSVVGLIIALLAFAVVNFVLTNVFK